MNRSSSQDPSSTRISDHYLGDRGRSYADSHYQLDLLRGQLSAWKFRDHIRPEDTLLDFGAGSGALLAALRAKSKIGVEPNPAGRERALSRAERLVTSLDEIESESVDVLVSNHALEHTISPAHELREMLRVLRSGSKLVLCLPIDDWRHERRFNVKDNDRHLYTWTPLLLGNLLTEVGFNIESIEIITGFWPPGVQHIYRHLGEQAFKTCSWLYGALRRRHEILAVARTGTK